MGGYMQMLKDQRDEVELRTGKPLQYRYDTGLEQDDARAGRQRQVDEWKSREAQKALGNTDWNYNPKFGRSGPSF